MKKITIYTMFTLLLLMGGVTIKAQEYMSIIQEGNVWNTLDVMVSMYNTYYNHVNWFSGDTIIDDVRYAKLMGTTDGDAPHLFSLLREEDGKVWKRNNQSEILLYDFTADVGDTLWCGNWGEYIYNIVDSISIEHIGGVDRKKFWFGLEYCWFGTTATATEIWIEGIGSDLGLLYSGSASTCGGYSCTLCFHQNGELVWQNPDYDNCTYVDAVEENLYAKMLAYPNPTKGTIKVEAENIRNVAIYNYLGEKIFETETSGNTFEYDFSDKKAGLYIIKVRLSDGKEFSERIVKE